MSFQENPNIIQWRLLIHSPIERVFDMLATNEGRAKWWAESAVEAEGKIYFVFPDGQTWTGKVVEVRPPTLFRVIYFGGSLTTFQLTATTSDQTELFLTDENVPSADQSETTAGWVSVLMALKAAADFDVDLRNHDPQRTWAQGYAEN